MGGTSTGTVTHAEGDPGDGGGSSGPLLYLALESERPLSRAARHDLGAVDIVEIGRGPARTATRSESARGRQLALAVPDRWMSGTHARLTRVLGRWLIEDVGSKNGTMLDGAPVDRGELADGSVLEIGHTFFVFRRTSLPTGAPADLDAAVLPAAHLGLSTLMPALGVELERLGKIARSGVSVVVRGASGTGKELVARAVHELSGRSGPFVAVNCGALPPGLVTSELFGNRRGAFSGASEDRPGLVRTADRGTLFLDEIGDLPLEAQPALLRVLQEAEVLAVGAERPVHVDLRVVAATHRDLDALVAGGTFRDDLLARLGGFHLFLPTLADRREELGLLVAQVLEHGMGRKAENVRFAVEAARAVLAHPWPGNVRELEKTLAAAVVLAGEGAVKLEHLPDALRVAVERPPPKDVPRTPAPLTQTEIAQRDRLVALLEQHHGNVSAVARELGKARMQIQRWLRRYALDPAAFR